MSVCLWVRPGHIVGSFVNLLEIDSPNRINDSINISNEPDNDFMTFSLFSKTLVRKFPNPKNAVFGNNLHFPKVDRAFWSSRTVAVWPYPDVGIARISTNNNKKKGRIVLNILKIKLNS